MISPGNGETILVVDDDPGLAQLMQKDLRREGYQTTAVHSGREAVRWLTEHPTTDLLLLDLKLPDMGGAEIIDAMRQAGRLVPFVIITGQGDERVAVEMMRKGALDYLVKDTNFIELLPTVVARALRQLAQKQKLAEAEAALARYHAGLEQRTAELSVANEELRRQMVIRKELEAEVLKISERERERLGQDLHDDLGQQLAGTWLLSDVVENQLLEEGSAQAENAGKICELLKGALALTRQLARGLQPVVMTEGGMATALEDLARRTSEMFRVACSSTCAHEIDLAAGIANHLYRIAQESVTNAVKHGKAKKIDIELSANQHHTVLTIKNNGVGMPLPESADEGIGLRIMRYRADLIGGTINFQSDASGTTVICKMPAPEGGAATSPSHEKEKAASGKRGSRAARRKGVHR